jgi:hypothetical protein
MIKNTRENFFEKVNKDGPIPEYNPTLGACWIWLRCKSKNGYGQVRINGKTQYAHRVSYLMVNDKIEDDLCLDHLCRNRSCVNPSHLEAVTPKINSERGILPNRTHCKNGHEFTADNIYIKTNIKWKARQCRKCARAAVKKYNANNKEKVREYNRNYKRNKKGAGL